MTTTDKTMLLTVAEVVRRCRVSETTVRESIRRPELPAVRWGRRVLVREVDLERFLEARTTEW